ncbi:MAG: 1-acyl-sn-glycerol-3-phosphate acyltransferase [Opitutaceae bacterium]|jgi:1-acyl-sn-glycerol-3-phosphate acyltransferase|nr:1-acyl-sn-glycerol-3-phosphate acyltransferase [Opitutaceae bacterium]
MPAREAFAQVRMQPLYGFCHYVLNCTQEAIFRGEVIGLENLPADGAFLLAANHASHLDPPFIGAVIPHQMAFFARKSLWKPGLGAWWMDGVGAIPVERDSADLAAIKRVIATLRGGRPIVLFPEGTRSPDGQLQPAKPGVGMIVGKTQVPVVPCRIFNSHLALNRHGGLRPGTPIHIVFGRPLSPADYDRPSDGKERYQRISERIMAAISRLSEPAFEVI